MIDRDAAMRLFTELTEHCHLTSKALRQFLTQSTIATRTTARILHHITVCKSCRTALVREAISIECDARSSGADRATEGQRNFTLKLPALIALLQKRQQHIKTLAEFVAPPEQLWMLPSLLDAIDQEGSDNESKRTLRNSFRAAAFTSIDETRSLPFIDDIIFVIELIDRIESMLVMHWGQVELQEHKLASLIDECCASLHTFASWDSNTQHQIKQYYLRLLLSQST